MDKVINRFAWLLRYKGVRISPAETIDALRALGELPISDRAAVKAALSGTLVKNQRDLPVFEETFERLCRLEDLLAGEDDHANGDGRAADPAQVMTSEETPELEDTGDSDEPLEEDVMDMSDLEDSDDSHPLHNEESEVAF